MRKNERKELHKISETRVSKWPNTITAERERKEYERIKRLEDDEVSGFDNLFNEIVRLLKKYSLNTLME